MKALVADSSAVMRKVLIGALGRANITDVDEASDGPAVVKASEAGEYDLILMEWDMPSLSGIEAVRKIRGTGCSTPIIIVSTRSEKSRVLEALKAGANDYVIKPFEPTTIVDKIRATLERVSSG